MCQMTNENQDNNLLLLRSHDQYYVKFLGLPQGNLKGESAVVAILPLHVELSYCTSGFFRS